jgi:hypothetical protein
VVEDAVEKNVVRTRAVGRGIEPPRAKTTS